MLKYNLVYTATDFDAGRWEFLGVGVFFMVLGAIMIALNRGSKASQGSKLRSHIFPWVWFVFACIWSVTVAGVFAIGWLEAKNALSENTYRVVSGPVTDFVAMPKEGHAEERFKVEGVSFHYSDFEITSGYRQSEAYGGYIHAKSNVRIGYICELSEADCRNPTIIRLEIQEAPAKQ